MPAEKTSKYLGVYFNAPSERWIVELENHPHHPAFFNERDAAIYAEYYLRQRDRNRSESERRRRDSVAPLAIPRTQEDKNADSNTNR